MKQKYKILNLYACLGGNRYKWNEVAEKLGIELEVTAVELDPELARLYKERFTNDIVIVADAHQYLLENFKEFDFIWSSPPCTTHSKARYWGFGKNGLKPVFPDMKLYEEIIFLKHHFFGKWVVENVNPYYEPLIEPQKRERHSYWSNFNIPLNISDRNDTGLVQSSRMQDLCDFHDYDFRKYKGKQRVLKIARNLVDYKAGKSILEAALNIAPKKVIGSLFDENYTEL